MKISISDIITRKDSPAIENVKKQANKKVKSFCRSCDWGVITNEIAEHELNPKGIKRRNPCEFINCIQSNHGTKNKSIEIQKQTTSVFHPRNDIQPRQVINTNTTRIVCSNTLLQPYNKEINRNLSDFGKEFG